MFDFLFSHVGPTPGPLVWHFLAYGFASYIAATIAYVNSGDEDAGGNAALVFLFWPVMVGCGIGFAAFCILASPVWGVKWWLNRGKVTPTGNKKIVI